MCDGRQRVPVFGMDMRKRPGDVGEVDTAGDGLLATFDGPAATIRCARAIQSADRAVGLSTRAGVHCGEVERAGRAQDHHERNAMQKLRAKGFL